MPTPPLKRPAAHGAPVKAELLSPAAKKKPGEGTPVKTAPPEPGEGEAEVPATPEAKARASPKPKTSPCRVKLSPRVLAKVKAKAKAKAMAKPGEGTLAPVPRDAWKDVHYQLKSLEKAGKSSLKKSFQACQSQQAKRRWYYNIFLLDPAISKKEVHKESLEKASTENSISRGWVTKWKVGELEGANPQAHDFEELCDGAVEGLEWKEHPNPSWRRKGVKLYWYEGQGMEVEKVKNQSLTKAKQSVELDADHFEEVESRLALQPGQGQLVLGKSSGSRGSGNPPKPKPGDGKDDDEHVPTPEEVEAEAYKKAPARRRPSRV